MSYEDILIFQDDEQLGILNDFVNNEVINADKKGFEVFLEKDCDLSEIAEKYFEALKLSVASFYKILKITPEKNEIILEELETGEKLNIMDINFSRTAKTDLVMFVRLIPYKDVYVFNGMANFIYGNITEEKLFRNFRREFRKVRMLNPNTAKYIAAYNVFKRYGFRTLFS